MASQNEAGRASLASRILDLEDQTNKDLNRYEEVGESDVRKVLEDSKNKNTQRKTKSDHLLSFLFCVQFHVSVNVSPYLYLPLLSQRENVHVYYVIPFCCCLH